MKKCFVRVLAFMLTLIMLFGTLPLTAFATESSMKLLVNSQTGVVGKTVQVTIDLKDNPGLTSLKFYVAHDEYLTLSNVEFNSDFGAYVTTPKPYVNPLPITLVSPLKEIDVDGTLATLTFEIAENAPDNYEAKISVTYNAKDVYDENGENIALTVVNGSVTIYHGIPGDVNNDTLVDTKDAILLFRHVADWDVDIDTAALDVNGDNYIDTKDAVTLFRYVADWPDIVLYRGEICTHNLIHNEAKAPNCTEEGQIEYWNCDNCGDCFSDEKGENRISLGETVISSLGHTEVVDEAVASTYDTTGLTEGKHCSVCNTVLIEQKEIAVLEPNYYAVTYRNDKGAVIADEFRTYAEHMGLVLPTEDEVKVDGYEFKGWYTEENGNGTRVYEIEPNSDKGTVTVYGHWTPITYAIVYTGVQNDFENGIHTYTVEDGNIYLSKNPEWKHLIFTGWEDMSGKLSYTENGTPFIPKGTTGDIEIKATWKNRQNIFETPEKQYSNAAFNEEDGKYYFFYHLGNLSNVLLAPKGENGRDHSGVEFTFTTSQTVTVGKEHMDSYSTAVSKAMQTSLEATLSSELTSTLSTTVGASATAGAGYDVGFAKANASATASTEVSASASYSVAGSLGTSTGTESSETNETSSSTSYMNEFSFTKEESYTLTADDPSGKYYYLPGGTFEIYSIVIYDPSTNELQYDVYSKHIDSYPMILYYPDMTVDSGINDIPYDVYEDEIAKTITESFFVFYEKGHNDVVVDEKTERTNETFKLNDLGNLPENNFYSRYGYVFDGWELRDANNNLLADRINDGEALSLLAQYATDYDCRVLKLVAKWKIKTVMKLTLNDQVADTHANYAEIYAHVGKGMFADYEGTTPISSITPPTKKGYVFGGYFVTIENNTFLDAKGTTCIVNPDGTFTGLMTDGYSYFKDDATIKALWIRGIYEISLNNLNGSETKFYSQYKTGIFTDAKCTTPITTNKITAPTRTGYDFLGYKDANGNYVIDKDGNIDEWFLGEYTNVTENLNFDADWNPHKYTVKYDSNGGTGTTVSSAHIYDVSKALTPIGFSKTGYTFTGWNTKADGSGTSYADKASVKNLTTTNNATVTLYAMWTANTYTVVYYANGGTGTMANSTHTYDVAKALTANAFTCTGYTFAGWNTKIDGSGTSYADKASVKNLTTTNNATVTLYAKWMANTYQVAYNANKPSNASGTVSGMPSSNAKWKYNANATLAAQPSLTGWTFGGWYKDATCTTKAGDAGATLTKPNYATSGTVTLYAKWTANTYMVAYDANGGTGTMTNSPHAYDTAKALTANAFTRTDYKFVGWNTKADGSGTSYEDKQSVKNLTSATGTTVTLYAQWGESVYTVNYNANGGTGTTAPSKHACDTAKALTANAFTRTGYTFDGWNTKADGSGTSYADKELVENLSAGGTAVTLYAKWKVNEYTVVYNANGGTGTMANSPRTYDDAKALTANAFTRTGYTFAGYWNTKADGSGTSYADKAVKNLTSEKNVTVTLYAMWTANAYTVVYNANGGTGTMANSPRTYNDNKALTANTFTRTGYTFAGYWNTKADGSGTSYADKAVKNLTSEKNVTVTLYAMWTANAYTVVYNANGGTGTMTNSSRTYDDAKALTANAFTRTGYSFAGWNTKADGSGTSYADKAVKNLTSEKNVTVTLYAMWTATYTVVYDANGGTGTTASSTHIYGISKALTANGFTRLPYYAFAGWNTKKDGTGTAYADKESVKNLTATAGAKVTLYAQWDHVEKYKDYTYIENRAGLEAIDDNPSGKYILIADIDLSTSNWEAISTFEGVLNGDGHTIKGLTCDYGMANGGDTYGLFKTVKNAEISNIKFENVAIQTRNGDDSGGMFYTGTVAGHATTSVFNNITIVSGTVYFHGSNSGEACSGAIVGGADRCTFNNCTNNASVHAEKGAGSAGGIVGITWASEAEPGTFNKCTNNGTITAKYMVWGGRACSAGIVGRANGSTLNLRDCYNHGIIDGWSYTNFLPGGEIVKGDLYNDK